MELSMFLLVIGLLVVLHLWSRKKWKRFEELTSNIPTVTNIPWKEMLMHTFSKHKDSTYNLYSIAEKLIAPFPDICKGWLGLICLIDIRNPEYVKKVLCSEKCLDRAVFYMLPYKTGLLSSGGDLWKRHRKMLNPAFSYSKVNSFLPIVNEKARLLTIALKQHEGKEAFNISRLLSACTLESLLRTSFGLNKDFINNPHDRFFTIVKKEATSIGRNITNLFNLFNQTSFNSSFWRERKNEFLEFCQQIFFEAEQKKSEFNVDVNSNFVEILLRNQTDLTSEEIQDEVSTLIMSGNASTAFTISSVLLMLAMHQDVQENVIEEINSVLPSFNDEINIDVINNLKYLDLVIKESMRLFPIAPIIGRKMTSDLKLDDTYILPKGANVVLRIIDIQRNPTLWGEDAREFKPERFLPEHLSKVHPYAFIPFSGGARICIGYRYASVVLKIVLCHILKKFKVHTHLKYEELKLEISFILRISQNYMIRLQKRNSNE